jgi:hypothetical protein
MKYIILCDNNPLLFIEGKHMIEYVIESIPSNELYIIYNIFLDEYNFQEILINKCKSNIFHFSQIDYITRGNVETALVGINNFNINLENENIVFIGNDNLYDFSKNIPIFENDFIGYNMNCPNSYPNPTFIKFENNKILIDFIGKKGVRNLAYCNHRIIYEYLNNKYKNASSKDEYIFSYGNNKIITSKDVNEYLKKISNYYSDKQTNTIITTKDLRTWNANILFISYFKKLRNNNNSIDKNIKNAIEMVAKKLHNTYSICKKSYIDPEIIANVAQKANK